MARNNNNSKYVAEDNVNATKKDDFNAKQKNNNTRNNKSRKSNGKDQRKPITDGSNDPRWYGVDSQWAIDAVKLGIAVPLGLPTVDTRTFSLDQPYTSVINDYDYAYNYEPFAMGIVVSPTIGSLIDGSSGANLAISKVQTYIRQTNGSVTRVYNAPDIMNYFLAVDSCHMFMYWLQRLYGLTNIYSVENRYFPKGICELENVDFSTITGDNRVRLKSYLDKYTNAVSQFPIPASLSYFARHAWLYKNVYTDVNATKSQIYMLTPGSFLRYDETDSNCEFLKYVPFGQNYGSVMTLSDIMQFGDSLISAIQNVEDFAYIAGDILKAYGYSNCVQIYEIPEQYVVPLTYSPEVLSQFQNSYAIGRLATTGIATDMQTNTLQYADNKTSSFKESHIRSVGSVTSELRSKRLTFNHDDITIAEAMVSTRLTPVWYGDSVAVDSGIASTFFACGSEVPEFYTIVTNARNNKTKETEYYTAMFHSVMGLDVSELSSVNNIGYYTKTVNWLSYFDWAPEYTMDIVDMTPHPGKRYPFLHIWETSAILDPGASIIERMHDIATQFEFNIAYTGSPNLK